MKEGWKPRIEPKDKPPSPDRRNFLYALGGFAASAALATETVKLADTLLERAMQTEESLPLRERILDGVVKTVGANIRSHAVREALEGRGRDPLALILKASEFPIRPEHLAGTSYDIEPLVAKFQVQIGIFPNQKNNELDLADRAAILQGVRSAADTSRLMLPAEGGYGNGVYWDSKHLLLTAAHVVSALHTEKPELANQPIDVGLLRVSKRFAAQKESEVVRDTGELRNRDIHANFVAVSGIDPDETADKKGRKIYPGIAMKISQSLVPFLAKAETQGALNDPVYQRQLARSFMVILPAGESKVDKKTGLRPAMGMSGSPVFVRQNGKLDFGGVLWGAIEIRVGSKLVDIGLFHGIDEVREATQQIKTEFIPDQ